MNQIIPVSGGSLNAHQRFEVQLGDNLTTMILNWRTLTEVWSLDIEVEGVRIVSGALLLPGSDIIEVWQTNLGRLVVNGDKPTLDNLGKNNQLVWVSPNG